MVSSHLEDVLQRFQRRRGFLGAVILKRRGRYGMRTLIIFAAVLACLVGAGAASAAGEARVSVGSPSAVTPQNHQNEPAVAMDAHNPAVLVAGVNDFVDWAPCPQQSATVAGTCFGLADVNVGLSGVYFSFDRGNSWVQPTYTGWTASDCAPAAPCTAHVGPIHTLPWYYENGLVSSGDPAVALGPIPLNGRFAWENGARVYYANLTSKFEGPGASVEGDFRGLLGVAVSRLDNPTPARVLLKSSWMPPVIAMERAGTFTLEDKEQIWADNAASSKFFGRVYVCSAQYRGLSGPGSGVPVPIMVSYSTDGGATWTQRQVTSSGGAGASFFQQGFETGCTIRTDSEGVVYLFLGNFRFGFPGEGFHYMLKSFDGGKHWTQPQITASANDMCFNFDPVYGRCVADGMAGARIDLSAAPSVDIANGAPTGIGATDEIVDAWSDGRLGLNNEKTFVAWSTNGGATWGGPIPVSLPGDRALYSAPAISPTGDRLYVVYEADLDPWRGADMTSTRRYRGVFLQAAIGAGGAPSGWTTILTGAIGDLRGTYPGHDIYQERIGDYVYAAASASYGVGVWTDARDAEVCPAVQTYRAASLAAGEHALPAPWPLFICPTFGNTDIWAATTG
jgi:hypothetical protein